MAVIGFSFIKFNCERKGNAKGSIEIKHNISIVNVEKTPLNMGSNTSEVLKIEFTFDVDYGESIGKISLLGDVIYTDTKEIIEETYKYFLSDKKLTQIVNEQVYKFLYSKALIKALDLSDSLNLPSPIPLPKVNFTSNKENKIN